MEFEQLNQPDFDRERDGSIREILKAVWTEAYKNHGISQTTFMQRAYNEGFKAGLKFIYDKFYVPDLLLDELEGIIAEVDMIDKGG